MDTHLVQMTDLVKDYAKIIDNLTTELEEYRSIAEKFGAAKAISDKAKWEELAGELIGFAELIRHIEGNDTRNAAYYKAAGEAIEE
jgi:hypothetical protein